MTKITSADWVSYNANTRGTRTGDCTARAISLAFNKDYTATRKLLNDSAKTHYNWNYNTHDNCIKVIRELGGGNLNSNTERVSVGSFADTHTSGTFIIWCSKDGITHKGNHLVTIIDGKIYDSWDSRKYFVKGYWTISAGVQGKDLNDIRPLLKEKFITTKDINWYNDYAGKLFDRIIDNNKKIKKIKETAGYDIYIQFEILKIKMVDYTFSMSYTIDVTYNTPNIKPQQFKGKVVVAFNPTMKPDQLDEYFNKRFYDKFYSFIYDVVVKIADTCEGYELVKNSNKEQNNLYFYDAGEEKSFNALPYWVRSLATSFTSERPDRFFGKRSDSVRLRMYRAPFDKDYDPSKTNDKIEFDAYDMSELREILQHYKETGNYEESYDIRYNY